MTDAVWLAEDYTPRPPLEGRIEAQVVIAGGGLTGIQLAHFLSAAKVSCVVLERDVVGAGATGRNAGMIMTGDRSYYPVSKHTLGPERTRAIWALTRENGRLLGSIVEELKLGCDYRREGSLRVALSPSEADLVRRTAGELQEDGFDVELYDLQGFPAAIRFPEDAEIHPVKYVRGLASRLRVYEGTPVVSVESRDGGVRVRTEAGEARGEIFVGATNALMRELLPFFESAILPVRGQMLVTEPLPERLIPLPVYFNFGREYARQLPTGEVLLGGGRNLEGRFTTTTEEVPTVKVQSFLDGVLEEWGVRAKVDRRWAGLMGFSCDELPDVGFLPGTVNTFACGGYTGHGLCLSTVLTRMAADLILHGESELPYALFDPRRHT